LSKDIKDLRWIRIFTPSHIPKYLIEQINDPDWSVEDYVKYHETNCLQTGGDGLQLNPFSHLYVLVDEANVTKGFLWFTVESLTKSIFIQNYSVDRAYWGKGRAIRKLIDHIKSIQKKAGLNKVFWLTNRPKNSQRYGFTASKYVLMEYSEEADGQDIDRRNSTQGQREHADTGTTEVSVGSSGS